VFIRFYRVIRVRVFGDSVILDKEHKANEVDIPLIIYKAVRIDATHLSTMFLAKITLLFKDILIRYVPVCMPA
jgi:hypothetical protein